MLTLTIGFALYYLMVGTLVWFVLWGRDAACGCFEGGNRMLGIAISLWIIVAWPEVLRSLAVNTWSRGRRS